MSLAIDVDRVTDVLLSDGWHHVEDFSFSLDSYEYVWGKESTPGNVFVLHGGGANGITATGFSFKEKGQTYTAGPLTAVQAVRYQATA